MAANTTADRPGKRIWRIAPWAAATLLLILPLGAMQFTDEISWSVADFVVIGAMLFGASGIYDLAARSTGNIAYRAAVGVALVTALALIWISLAVGIIGSEGNPANLMYGGVLAVGIFGSLLVRFRPCGMARVFTLAALAQVAVGAIAVFAGPGSSGANWPEAIVVLTGLFSRLLDRGSLAVRAGSTILPCLERRPTVCSDQAIARARAAMPA